MNTRPSACKADALPAELLKDIGDATGTRTPITAVKGRCPNRLDDGVMVHSYCWFELRMVELFHWWTAWELNPLKLACKASA